MFMFPLVAMAFWK